MNLRELKEVVSKIYCAFDQAVSIITTMRETAELIRTYGEGPDLYGASRTAHIAKDIHAVAAHAESEVRGLRAWDAANAQVMSETADLERDRAAGLGAELRVGLWPLTFDFPAVTSHVAYPRPDLASRVEKLHAAAEDLRKGVADWIDAVMTPSTPAMCEHLHGIAGRVQALAESLSEETIM